MSGTIQELNADFNSLVRKGQVLARLDPSLIQSQIEHARAKRAAKRVPLIIANQVQQALGADSSELHLVDARGVTTLPRADKQEQARRLIAAIAERLG